MIEITLASVNFNVGEMRDADGNVVQRALLLEDPDSGIKVTVPFDVLSATKCANMLSGKGLIAVGPGQHPLDASQN